ncbi:hypothetical protein [Flavobacterium sp. ASW18X]|uniref:hypothetical protein n=1 Tax=Flavobacterium sp. ASW18X TaxID=2572595 RepID=UPI0010AEB277|nr:hypothetical protein [Flavobacterium sp. ASW18X]TKD65875.1 hypothetical protein FBT53_03130 [Flavobacterium sp. ASW18X]
MKKAWFLSIIGLVLLFSWSCREDFDYEPSVGQLSFSKDTVFLDTVFKGISSSTYSLTVYNTSSTDIRIPTVTLKNGEQSQYRLNVNGNAGNSFTDVPLLAKDSLFIFIETTVTNVNENEFLYTDVLQLGQEDNYQEVPLITLVKQANFIYADGTSRKKTIQIGQDIDGNPIQVDGFVLKDDQLELVNTQPYVVYGYAIVPENKQLNVAAGSRVHFHSNSGIYISSNSQLNVNGVLSEDINQLENEVIFEGDRLEPEFAHVAGQWGGIIFEANSINNSLHHLTIKNAQIGIQIKGAPNDDAPNIQLNNCQIHNSSIVNMMSQGGSFTAVNSVFGSAGNNSVLLQKGGSYSFTHCTLANYWNEGFRTQPAFFIHATENGGSYPLSLVMENSIIDGSTFSEIALSIDISTIQELRFNHTSLKTTTLDLTPDISIEASEYFINPILNPALTYLNPNKLLFWPQSGSETLDIGDPNISADFPKDIHGVDRMTSPDLGAKELLP